VLLGNEAGSRIGVRLPTLQSLGACLGNVRSRFARSCRTPLCSAQTQTITASSLCQSLLSWHMLPLVICPFRVLLLVPSLVSGPPYCFSLLCCTSFHLARKLAIVLLDIHLLPRLVQIRVAGTPLLSKHSSGCLIISLTKRVMFSAVSQFEHQSVRTSTDHHCFG
jgi:hypothetical protein